eukprot:4226660-Pleurochrysis_carterae.AAC.1
MSTASSTLFTAIRALSGSAQFRRPLPEGEGPLALLLRRRGGGHRGRGRCHQQGARASACRRA